MISGIGPNLNGCGFIKQTSFSKQYDGRGLGEDPTKNVSSLDCWPTSRRGFGKSRSDGSVISLSSSGQNSMGQVQSGGSILISGSGHVFIKQVSASSSGCGISLS